MAISQLKNHNFKEKDTSFSSTLGDDKNKVCLLTIYLAYKLKNGHFLVTMAIFDILPTTFPTVHWDEDNFAKFFFWLLLFFMLDHDILEHCASYKCIDKGDFSFFHCEISINRWETPKISENSCLPINLTFWYGFETSYGYYSFFWLCYTYTWWTQAKNHVKLNPKIDF